MSEAAGRRGRWPAGLPPLRGWAWRLFAACWILLLASALAATVAVLPDLVRPAAMPHAAAARYGLLLGEGGASVPVLPLASARAAGIGVDDRVVAIDGLPIPPAADRIDRQFAAAGDRPVTVTTRSPEGAEARHVLRADIDAPARSLAAVGLSPILFRVSAVAIALLADTIPLLVCAVLLMARRARDPLAPWASAMMLLLVIGNNETGNWFQALFPDPDWAYYIANGCAFALLNAVLALFPNGRFEPRWSVPVAVIGVVATIITEPLPSSVSNIVLVVTMLAAVPAVGERYQRMPPGAGRQQIRWALLGFSGSMLSLALLAVAQAAIPFLDSYGAFAWQRLASVLLGSAFETLLIVAMTVALLRYRLYGADATISRSVSYGLLTVGLLAVFAASEKLFEILGEHYLGEELGALAGALGAAAAAVTIVPLHHRVTSWAERRFRSGLAHLRHGLPLLVGDLRETASPALLADTMLARVEGGVRARHGAVVTGGQVLDARDINEPAVRSWLADHPLPADAAAPVADRADPLLPLRVPLRADGVGLVGWLLLGPRPDGSFYGREERAALAEIADPVARALGIALERDARDAARRAEAERVRREVGELRGLVLALQERIGLSAPA